jgi:hypothetical protein
MCTLHEGQIVEVAAEVISWTAPQSKQVAEVMRGRLQIPSMRRNKEAALAPTSLGALGALGAGASFRSTTKCLPHCRQSVLRAAAYSIC